MEFSIYNMDTGIICRTGSTTFEALPALATSGEGVIIGTRLDWSKYYVDREGFVAPKTLPSQEDVLMAKILLRNKRNKLLNEVDLIWCNAERWTSYTEVQRQEWSLYKQALRDFPDNCSDPLNPVWPTPPQ